ncbi:MAG: NAD(+) diphosphatase [Chelatococcus sp.]|nr:MAG: NAD(+) diphosphatase [Chelatococcus sp.]
MNDQSSSRRERSAFTGFSTNTLDRREDLRNKPDAVTALRHRSDTRLAVVAGDTPILNRLEDEALSVWFSHGETEILGPALEEVFLGLTIDGAPRFARLIDKGLTEVLGERSELMIADLRSVALKRLVPEDEVGPLGEAKAVLDWHARHRFCAQCGGATRLGASGWKRECEACGAQHFPRTDPVVIMLVTRGDKCLLARQSRFAPGMYSCIAGFVEPGETLENAVRRESWEEAGLRVGTVRYLASQPWPFPSSIMIGCIAESLGDEITLDMSELEAGRWFPREEVLQMLDGAHPEGLTCPQHIAIANTLVRAWALEGETV